MARVFIADDDPDIRQLLTYALADEGHQVSAAKDGHGALEAILLDPPDVLILDIMMPEMGGYEVLEALDVGGVRDRMKILVISAKGTERDLEEGFSKGADFYMTKPFDPLELTQVVATLLATPDEELAMLRQREQDRAHLLSQLEDIFGDS